MRSGQRGGCILSGRSTPPPVSRKVLLNPGHPERICWGCEKYCPADDLACGNGTIRTPHPSELFGDDWLEWEAGRAESLQAEPL